ncbi:MAG: type II toxin-antitoxin system HicA family toxin [Scytonematopsis contorta HA4267-MV1]|nr:type II toxin-antitoxin system HicA family toxin [Scytonematopsis contorta HA4267-MV1]
MNSMSGKELAKLLERNGWVLLRVKGSHHVYVKSGNPSKISVPIHGNKDLKIGLLRNLLKTAGLLENVSQEKPPEQGVDDVIDKQSDAIDVE